MTHAISLPEFRTEEREPRINMTMRIRPELRARVDRLKAGSACRARDVNRYLENALELAIQKMEEEVLKPTG